MSTIMNNMKVDISEYESLGAEYDAIKDDIERCTKRFFQGVSLMEQQGIIEGHVAQNLKTYSEKVRTIVDDELVEVLGLVERAITHTYGYVNHIEETDQFNI